MPPWSFLVGHKELGLGTRCCTTMAVFTGKNMTQPHLRPALSVPKFQWTCGLSLSLQNSACAYSEPRISRLGSQPSSGFSMPLHAGGSCCIMLPNPTRQCVRLNVQPSPPGDPAAVTISSKNHQSLPLTRCTAQ